MDKIYYRLFNFNNEDDAILINGRIPIILNAPIKLNEMLSINKNQDVIDTFGENCCIVNIPMIEKLYIKSPVL